MRLFFDANTLFTAAHNPDGKAALVAKLGAEGYWSLCTSDYAVIEARRNLAAKFPAALPRLVEQLAAFSIGRDDPALDCPFGLPPKDQPIYRAARAAGSTHLLTGDMRDFGPHMNLPALTHGLVVQTVAQFLRDLQNRSQGPLE